MHPDMFSGELEVIAGEAQAQQSANMAHQPVRARHFFRFSSFQCDLGISHFSR